MLNLRSITLIVLKLCQRFVFMVTCNEWIVCAIPILYIWHEICPMNNVKAGTTGGRNQDYIYHMKYNQWIMSRQAQRGGEIKTIYMTWNMTNELCQGRHTQRGGEIKTIYMTWNMTNELCQGRHKGGEKSRHLWYYQVYTSILKVHNSITSVHRNLVPHKLLVYRVAPKTWVQLQRGLLLYAQ